MELHSWLAFVTGTIIICGTPGPNMLQVMNSSIRYGFKPAFFTMLGCFSGVYLLFTVSMLGVGAFLIKFPAAFDILRYAGAAYLIYLGVMAWRSNGNVTVDPDLPVKISRTHIYRDGFLVAISNPKAMLFAVAFFPQFLKPDAQQAMQFVILLGTFAVIEVSWYLIYAFSGKKLANLMKKENMRRLFDKICGSLFIMFGIGLLAKQR